jgi:hypothetical protein
VRKEVGSVPPAHRRRATTRRRKRCSEPRNRF